MPLRACSLIMSDEELIKVLNSPGTDEERLVRGSSVETRHVSRAHKIDALHLRVSSERARAEDVDLPPSRSSCAGSSPRDRGVIAQAETRSKLDGAEDPIGVHGKRSAGSPILRMSPRQYRRVRRHSRSLAAERIIEERVDSEVSSKRVGPWRPILIVFYNETFIERVCCGDVERSRPRWSCHPRNIHARA